MSVQASSKQRPLPPALSLKAKDTAAALSQRNGHPYKPSSVRGYSRDLNIHVIPVFGACRLNRLQRPDLQLWVDRLTAGNRAPSTVKNIAAAFRATLAFGEMRGWIHHNMNWRVRRTDEGSFAIASPVA